MLLICINPVLGRTAKKGNESSFSGTRSSAVGRSNSGLTTKYISGGNPGITRFWITLFWSTQFWSTWFWSAYSLHNIISIQCYFGCHWVHRIKYLLTPGPLCEVRLRRQRSCLHFCKIERGSTSSCFYLACLKSTMAALNLVLKVQSNSYFFFKPAILPKSK